MPDINLDPAYILAIGAVVIGLLWAWRRRPASSTETTDEELLRLEVMGVTEVKMMLDAMRARLPLDVMNASLPGRIHFMGNRIDAEKARADKAERERDEARLGSSHFVDSVWEALGAAGIECNGPGDEPALGVRRLAAERDEARAEVARLKKEPRFTIKVPPYESIPLDASPDAPIRNTLPDDSLFKGDGTKCKECGFYSPFHKPPCSKITYHAPDPIRNTAAHDPKEAMQKIVEREASAGRHVSDERIREMMTARAAVDHETTLGVIESDRKAMETALNANLREMQAIRRKHKANQAALQANAHEHEDPDDSGDPLVEGLARAIFDDWLDGYTDADGPETEWDEFDGDEIVVDTLARKDDVVDLAAFARDYLEANHPVLRFLATARRPVLQQFDQSAWSAEVEPRDGEQVIEQGATPAEACAKALAQMEGKTIQLGDTSESMGIRDNTHDGVDEQYKDIAKKSGADTLVEAWATMGEAFEAKARSATSPVTEASRPLRQVIERGQVDGAQGRNLVGAYVVANMNTMSLQLSNEANSKDGVKYGVIVAEDADTITVEIYR